MRHVDRRRFIAGASLAAGGLALPRFAIGQADNRPTLTIAVQQIANSAALEVVRERSNVGERVQQPLFENLIARNLEVQARADPRSRGELEADRRSHGRAGAAQGREVPQRRRNDVGGRGLHLRSRAHVWRRLRQQLEQDAVHHGAGARQHRRQEAPRRGAGHRQAYLAVAGENRSRGQVHGALRQPCAGRDARRSHWRSG